MIGSPISVDELTRKRTRLAFARLCVLITPTSPLPETLDIFVQGQPVSQPVIYDWKPNPCTNCSTFSHSTTTCQKQPNPQQQPQPPLIAQQPTLQKQPSFNAPASAPQTTATEGNLQTPIQQSRSPTHKDPTLLPPPTNSPNKFALLDSLDQFSSDNFNINSDALNTALQPSPQPTGGLTSPTTSILDNPHLTSQGFHNIPTSSNHSPTPSTSSRPSYNLRSDKEPIAAEQFTLVQGKKNKKGNKKKADAASSTPHD